MSKSLEITANLLEKVAAYVDAIEAEKLAAKAADQEKIAESLRTLLADRDIAPDGEVLYKVSSDPKLAGLIETLANTADAEEFGEATGNNRFKGASYEDSSSQVKDAEDRFVNWLMS